MNKIMVSSPFHPTRWLVIGCGTFGTLMCADSARMLMLPFVVSFPVHINASILLWCAAGCALSVVALLQAWIVIIAMRDMFSREPYVQAPFGIQRLVLLVLYVVFPLVASLLTLIWATSFKAHDGIHTPVYNSLQETCSDTTLALLAGAGQPSIAKPKWCAGSANITGLSNLPKNPGKPVILLVQKGNHCDRSGYLPVLVSYQASGRSRSIFHAAYLVGFQIDTGHAWIVSGHIFAPGESATIADLDRVFENLRT